MMPVAPRQWFSCGSDPLTLIALLFTILVM
jgi:hypothetical protein